MPSYICCKLFPTKLRDIIVSTNIVVNNNLRGDLAFSLLAPALRARFSSLFGVAARKSVFAWRESPVPRAQVVVLDATSDAGALKPLPPCVIWVGAAPPSTTTPSAWVGRLAQDYTVSDLIDMLDRAAVFLMDWKARQRTSAAVPASAPAVSAGAPEAAWADSSAASVPANAAMAVASERRYGLNAWVFLGAPFDSPNCISALALLARQPVTVQQLQAHSGLTPVLVVQLLQELSRRKVLRTSAPAPAPLPSPERAQVPPAVVQRGFLRRLSHWLQGAQR